MERDLVEALCNAEEALSSQGEGCHRGDTLAELRRLALLPGGFGSNEMRRRIWPLLLGYSSENIAEFYKKHRIKLQIPPFTDLKHADDTQIQLDVNRSLGHDRWMDLKGLKRNAKRKALFSSLHATMCISKDANYNQGFHDVASVFLLGVGMPLAIPLLVRMSQTYMREPMRKNFDTVLPVFRFLYPLLATQDPKLAKHIASSVDQAYFALPWVLTWFSHHLDSYTDVARLFDVLLASHPLFSLYLSAALILENRDRVLACECDFGMLHSLLQSLPKANMNMEVVIKRANDLFENIPPDEVQIEMDRSSFYFIYPFPHQRRLGVKDIPSLSLRQRRLERNYLFVLAIVVGIAASLVSVHRMNRKTKLKN